MPKRSGRERGITWAGLCELAKRLPGVEVGTSYGTPSLHVRKKFLARLKEDGENVAVRVGFDDRDVLLALDPAAFHLTDHYRPYPAVLVRLNAVRHDLLERLIEQAWRRQAPRKLLPEAAGGGVVPERQAPARRPARRGKPGRPGGKARRP